MGTEREGENKLFNSLNLFLCERNAEGREGGNIYPVFSSRRN